MGLAESVKKILGSKKKGDEWILDALPLMVDIAEQIKDNHSQMEKDTAPIKEMLKLASEDYVPIISNLIIMDSQLRERAKKEHEGDESIKKEGVGTLAFPTSWDYEIEDLSKVPKSLTMTVLDKKAVMSEIGKGVRNIKGLKIKSVTGLRLYPKGE